MTSLLAAALTHAQPQATTRPAAPPAPDAAMAAYEQVEAWVRAWEVPARAKDASDIGSGLCLTLRLGGVVLARASALEPEPGALARLTRDAIDQATEAMPFDRDVFWDQRLDDAAQRVTVSLELAGDLVPMREANDYERELALNPGLDGLAVRYQDNLEGMFPGTMLATATTPGSALNVVRARLVDDPALLLDPDKITGVKYYRFRSTHVAQPEAGDPPTFLHRGGRVVPLATMNEQTLADFADDMAAHLLKREWTGPEPFGMYGTYHPTTGEHDPVLADAVAQGLTAYALCRYVGSPDPDPRIAREAGRMAARLLADLAVVEGEEEAPWDSPMAAASCLLAFDEARATDGGPPETAAEMIARCRDTLAGAFSTEDEFAVSVPVSAYGLVTHALAATAATPDERRRAEAALRTTYALTPPDQLAAQLPWLGWAELALADGPEVPAAVALRETRDAVWKDQFTGADAAFGDQDMVGGIVLTTARMSPLPSWHTARRVAFLATMLGDERLTGPDEANAEIVRLLRSVRFLRQLAVDEVVGHMCRSPLRARGGIRSSLWEQRMPPDATAFSLLAVTEMQRSLDAVRTP